MSNEEELSRRDEIISLLTGAIAEEISQWFKVQGRADDLPLLLKKKAKVTLQPIVIEVEASFSQRGWPDSVVDSVMAKVHEAFDGRIREQLFGDMAMGRRAAETRVSIKKRTRLR